MRFEISPDIYDAIITDEEWLWQMMLNLLTNACKYTDQGDICLSLSVVERDKSTTLAAAETEKVHTFPQLPALSSHHVDTMLLCEVYDTGKLSNPVLAP